MTAASEITTMELSQAAQALGRAFFDDPLMEYMLPDEHAALAEPRDG